VAPDALIGAEIAGYRVEALIGRGGMGAVYRARHLRLDRLVALKLLAPHLADQPGFRERFLRESRLAASLEHPHIVPIHDAGDDQGTLYLVMRLVDGADLKAIVDRNGPLDPALVALVSTHVARALDAAHAAALVHRDVKPGNVLVAGQGDEVHAYLTDFGLGKQVESASGLTGTGQLVGTIEYVAPELVTGQPVDGRADQYGLACVVFECLCGKPPFHRASEAAVLWAHVQEPPPSAKSRRPELSAETDLALSRALSKAPDDRYPSCAAFASALREAVATPVPERRQRRAPWWRSRAALATIVVTALAAASVLVGVLVLAGGSGGAEPSGPLAPANAIVVLNTSGKVMRSVPAGRDPTAILARGGFIWEADGAQRALIRLDAATWRSKTLPLGVTPTALAPGPLGSVWAAAGLAHKLLEVDGRKGKVYRTLSIPGCCQGPDVLTAAAGALWLADPGGTRRIDPNSGKFGTPVKTVGAGGIAADASGAIWVSDGWDTIRSIDPANGQLSPPLRVNGLGGGPAGPGTLVSTGGALWVAGAYAHEVIEINPNQAQVVQNVRVPGTPTAIAATSTSVWVATDPGGILSRIDASGRVTKWSTLGRRVGALAVSDGELVAATEASPAAQRVMGDIAYDAAGRIVLVHTSSDARQFLTSTSTVSAYPTWSPDGSRLAFVQTAGGDIGEVPTHVLEIRADGAHLFQLTHGSVEDTDPAWSPNGRWIVFVRLSSPGALTGQLWLVRPDGRQLHQLTHGVSAQTPSWTRDGHSIVFAVAPAGVAQSLGEISLGRSRVRVLASAAGFEGAPAESPDGVHIAYGSQVGTAITAGDSAPPVHLVTSAALQAPAWSPDGSQIAVAGVLGDISRLLIVDADGTGLSPIGRRFGAPASSATTANGADVAWRPHT
jgi:Protein kinase domain/WD40-like Beta Propeller Repeat